MLRLLLKLAVITGLAFHTAVEPHQILREGDSGEQPSDEIVMEVEEPQAEEANESETMSIESAAEAEEPSEEMPSEGTPEPMEETDTELSEVQESEAEAAELQLYSETETDLTAEVPEAEEETEVPEEIYTASANDPAACTVFGFCHYNGKDYWYEEGKRQAVKGDPKNIIDGQYHVERGREIYDPTTDAWYWLDADSDGAKATGKEVWMPYIYQQEAGWSDEEKQKVAYESDPGMGECVLDAMNNNKGKWVRYDENGKMLKGWVTIEGALAIIYPNQAGNIYYYDTRTGLMAKGWVTIGGKSCYFDEISGKLVIGEVPGEGGESDPEEDDEPGEYDEAKGQAIVQAAYAQLGSTDLCSVVVNNALAAIGVDCTVRFPGGGWYIDTYSIRDAGKRVDSPEPGDVAFYSSNYYGTSSHVAVYVGDGKVVSGNFNGSTQLVPAYIGGQQSQPEYYRYY